MSKLVTDSKVLLDFLFEGTGPDDTMLTNTVDALKQAAFDCMETRVTGFNLTEEQRAKLESVNLVLVETWQHLCALSNDFADLVASKMK